MVGQEGRPVWKGIYLLFLVSAHAVSSELSPLYSCLGVLGNPLDWLMEGAE